MELYASTCVVFTLANGIRFRAEAVGKEFACMPSTDEYLLYSCVRAAVIDRVLGLGMRELSLKASLAWGRLIDPRRSMKAMLRASPRECATMQTQRH